MLAVTILVNNAQQQRQMDVAAAILQNIEQQMEVEDVNVWTNILMADLISYVVLVAINVKLAKQALLIV